MVVEKGVVMEAQMVVVMEAPMAYWSDIQMAIEMVLP